MPRVGDNMTKYITITFYNKDECDIKKVQETLLDMGLEVKKIQKHNDIDSPVLPKKKPCCKNKKEKPLSFVQAGKNLFSDTKEHITKGLKQVPEEEYQRRINICKECEHIKSGFRCDLCKCFMKVKAKWDIKRGCKLKKW